MAYISDMEFIETSVFTRHVFVLLTDEEYPKSRKDTLSDAEVRTLRNLVEEWLHG